ncbi:MAG: hypothetical protein JEY94_00795 [Melioribacteraceae bacterium]|nr:hypothetical protein [Melioribacteraceae bacterium]
MKKIILILFMAIFIGCDEIPDGVVEKEASQYDVLEISAPDDFIYSETDSVFNTYIEFNSSEAIKNVTIAVLTIDGSKKVLDNHPLADNGIPTNGDQVFRDNKYSALVTMGKNTPIGKYQIEYYVTGQSNSTNLVGFHNFDFDRSKPNTAPVVSGLLLSDTLGTGDDNPFFIELSVSDEDGYNDIKSVLFNLYDENDQLMNPNIFMYDDGNTVQNGDKTAGDGIFSFKNTFNSSAIGKTRKFEFWAIDLSNAQSNVITKEVYIK